MVQSQNQADEFDTVVLLDENAVREGRTEGILKGRIEGLREGA